MMIDPPTLRCLKRLRRFDAATSVPLSHTTIVYRLLCNTGLLLSDAPYTRLFPSYLSSRQLLDRKRVLSGEAKTLLQQVVYRLLYPGVLRSVAPHLTLRIKLSSYDEQ